MLKIINYFEYHNKATYKELSVNLNIKERLVRYDIDRINDILGTYKLPEIEKRPKGVLIFPEVKISSVLNINNFSYDQNERINLLLLILLLDNKRLKLNHLSEDFQVSRATIKNDLDTLGMKLKKNNIYINYSKYFYLSGEKNDRVLLLNNEFKKYTYLFRKKENELNFFEKYALNIIEGTFHGIPPESVLFWVDELLENMGYILSDASYNWYVSNILGLVWFVLNNKTHPSEQKGISSNNILFDYNQIKKLENIIHKSFSEKEKDFIVRLLNYTNKYKNYDRDINLIYVEAIVFQLISVMSEKMNIQFEKDISLIEGLLNHMTPLILRIQENVYISEDIDTTLSVNDMQVFEMVCQSLKEINILKDIRNREDIIYITIHFLASVERRKKYLNCRVLIVCGFGYGTTTMLRENLLNEYQVEIIDAIPVNKLGSYNNWENIDIVISTSIIDIDIPKEYLVVNQIPTAEDHKNIEEKGILRKKVLTNYYSLKDKLDFLKDSDRLKVLNLLQQEFGYENKISLKEKGKTLSEFIDPENIILVNKKMNWEEAVYKSSYLLEKRNCVNALYKEEIINTINKIGFYSITDQTFALLHGDSLNIQNSGMSLLVNKEEIHFGEKVVNLVFCLASKDKKEHIPAVTMLMRLVRTTNIVQELIQAETTKEIYNIITEFENGGIKK
jgi:transcriptional antiterminator/mannitol/fructose-specific phosphotransferase system IIA component (Ntr-type)